MFFSCEKGFSLDLARGTEKSDDNKPACEMIASETDLGGIAYGFAIGSSPLFLIAANASGDAKNRMTLRAAFESVLLAAMPAENTDTFCTSGGNGVM